MTGFADLKSLYEHLEKNADDYKYPHQIGGLFQNLRDLRRKENKLNDVEKAQCEIDVFNFVIKNNQIEPTYSWTDDKGKVLEYPSMDNFNEKTYEYLNARLVSISNPWLKARYSHILWCSPKRNAKYAEVAVDAYLDLIQIYQEKEKQTPQERFGLNVLHSIENAYSIAYQIDYRTNKVKSEIIRLILNFNFNSSSSFTLRSNLIELMLRGKKNFLKQDFDGIGRICWKMSKVLIKAGNHHGAIDMLKLGERVDQKIGKRTHNWRMHIAESYETLMDQAGKDNNLATITFCKFSIENYKKVKQKRKVIELEKKYIELKTSMRMGEFKTEIDLTQIIKWSTESAEKVVQNNSDEIITFLMTNGNLLPKYKDMEKRAEEDSKKFVFQHLSSKEIIDERGHTTQHFSAKDEKKYYDVLQHYGWELKLNTTYFINAIFFAAIQHNKLSARILLEFLNRHSWFGKTMIRNLPTGKTLEYNWLNLLAPAINEYFRIMHFYFLGATKYPNLVLPIDSLTLKIEGLIRDICQHSDVKTFYQTKDKKGRIICREKDIHALLYEQPLKQLFDENDLLFFRFLLVEKLGYNLRHKIAHSFMLFEEYTFDFMHLLILALLRLGKYDFVKKKEISSSGREQ